MNQTFNEWDVEIYGQQTSSDDSDESEQHPL